MNISENILKHNLKNVYFLTGTACSGKTTMCKALADKHGFIFFNSNHRTDDFISWAELCDIQYQKVSAQKTTDWEYFFNRPTKEYLEWLEQVGAEHLEYALIEIIKLAQTNTIITDLGISIDLLKQISSFDRIACLFTTPELVVRDFYERDDHKDIYECIMSLKNPQQSLENNKEVLKTSCLQITDEILRSSLYCIKRDENSTVEKTLALLEKHFKLD
ncbi:MAG: hypothetical protein PHR20_05680 [Bacteroidales bacterium]|nr:hypothetical protein [Bacteroidales bacterium]